MEVFHRAADLIGLDRRVRMELEEPDYEHIFYVTVKLHTRLSPLVASEQSRYKDLPDSELLPDGLEPLLDGSFVFKRRALINANVFMRDGVVRLKGKGLYKVVPWRQLTDGERERPSLRGVVTGKDTRIGGSEGRVRATGQGLAYCIQEWYADRGSVPAGSRFVLQGFGNVGSNAAEILASMGSKLLAVNDAGGTIFNPNGIDVPDLVSYVYDNPSNMRRTVAGYPKAQQISRNDLWDVDADILIPAALGGEITGPVAERIKVTLVAEGANGPTTAAGDRVP